MSVISSWDRSKLKLSIFTECKLEISGGPDLRSSLLSSTSPDGRGGCCWSRFSSSPPPGAGAVASAAGASPPSLASSRACSPSSFVDMVSFDPRVVRSFVRSSSSSSSRSLKQCKCDEKIELDCDREKQKKKGKRKRQHKSFRFWVGARVSKFKISHFLTHIDAMDL